jgi:sugar phosphate isomerase/epimerase
MLATLTATAATVGSHAMSSGAAEHTSGQVGRRWGVQLYTVRDQIGADAAVTLKRLAAIGYSELEVLQPTLTTVAPLAAPLRMTIVSAHLDLPTTTGEGYDAFLAQAKAAGLRYIVFPYVAPGQRPVDRAGFEALAARLARMARTATAAGLRLCYHNHAFEFGKDPSGTRWIDVLMQHTADAGLHLQLDVFWASIAGADPVALLKQYAGRVSLVHLKDRSPDAPTSVVESAQSRTSFVELGAGTLPFPSILAAARAAGVQHYFVEQDYTPGDPIESLRKSHAYLAGLGMG